MNNIIDYKKIGNRIKQQRKKLDITQEKICNDLNISLYHYSKVENARVSASFETLVEIANYLELELTCLLTGISKLETTYFDNEMMAIYSKCDDQQKQLILEFAKIIINTEIKSISTGKQV